MRRRRHLQGRPKKWVHRVMTIILSNLNRFKKITGRFLGKFVVKWILKIPPHLAYVATLPCETLASAKQAINDKLQDCVATYNKKGLQVKKKLVNIWQSYKQERGCLMHFARLANTLLTDEESAGPYHVLAC